MPRDKAASIFFELGELEGALEAAQALAVDLQGEPWRGNPEATRRLDGLGSVPALLTCRVRLLRQGVEGAVDPALLLARHNEVPTRETGPVADLKLLPRSRSPKSGR
jgi:hypothetical protein